MTEQAPVTQNSLRVIPSFIYPELGKLVAAELGITLAQTDQKVFPNTEAYARIAENVRGQEVFIIGSHVATERSSVNDAVWQMALLADAAVHASAQEVTLIAPFLGYQRQDRKSQGREALSARVIRQLFEATGVKRVMTIDAHSPAVQSGYNIVFDHLTALPELEYAITQTISPTDRDRLVVVAPDAGALKMNQRRATSLGTMCLEMSKRRDPNTGQVDRTPTVHEDDIKDQVAIIFDDIIDTAGTMVSAAEILKAKGAAKVILAATHGIFSGPALERLRSDAIDLVFTTDTFPMETASATLKEKLHVVSVAPLLGKSILAIHEHGSISDIFDQQNYR